MQIRKEQFEQFSDLARGDFHRRLLVFLREKIPQEVESMDDQALAEYIARCDARASRLGVESEAARAQFVCLSFLAGPTFDDIPEVKAFFEFTGDELTPDEKVEVLVDQMSEEEGPSSA